MNIIINSKDFDTNNINITFEKSGKSFTHTINTIYSYDLIENGYKLLIKENVINDDEKLNSFLENYIQDHVNL